MPDVIYNVLSFNHRPLLVEWKYYVVVLLQVLLAGDAGWLAGWCLLTAILLL